MLLGSGCLSVGTVDISKHFVGLTLFLTVAVLHAQLKELLQVLNGVVMVVWGDLLLNQSDLLVALSFLVLIVCALCHVKAFFKEG